MNRNQLALGGNFKHLMLQARQQDKAIMVGGLNRSRVCLSRINPLISNERGRAIRCQPRVPIDILAVQTQSENLN